MYTGRNSATPGDFWGVTPEPPAPFLRLVCLIRNISFAFYPQILV